MRARTALFLACLLLSGCSSPAKDDDAPGADVAGVPYETYPGAGEPVPMRFATSDYDATVSYDESFDVPSQPCLYGVTPCDAIERRIDLTAQVPPEAPVELAASFTSTACVNLDLELDGAAISRISSEYDGPLAASIVRELQGTVTLLLTNCSFLSVEQPVGQAAVSVEVRTVVRADQVPAYVPVAVDLEVGDGIAGWGDDLERLIVVAPEQPPLHLEGPFTFNVTEETGAGTYVLVAIGQGDLAIAGPNATLRALTMHYEEGEAHAVPTGGGAVSWDLTVPGVPLQLGLIVTNQDVALGSSVLVVSGAYTWTLEQSGTVLAEWTDTDPVPLPVPVPGITFFGSQTSYAYAEFLDARMTRDPFTFTLDYDVAHGLEAHHLVYWVEP